MNPDLYVLLVAWLAVSSTVWAFAGDKADAKDQHTYWTETKEAE